MYLKKFLIVLLWLVLFATGVQSQDMNLYTGIVDICGDDALSITSADSLTAEEAAPLDDLLRQFVTFPAEGETPLNPTPALPGTAAVIMVDSPDGTYFRSIGTADFDACTPVDPATPFPIGSNTKMFTATVIYQLQEAGLLSTIDLVSMYLPDEIALWGGADSITIDMLLGHTSGLPDYLNSESPSSIGKRIENLEPGLIETAFTPHELIENSAESDPQLLFTPGAEAMWSYSNTGYIMLGMIIEQLTGQTYIEAVTERIIDPLGLEHTTLLAGAAPDELGLVGQYLISPVNPEVIDVADWNGSQAWSAGNIVSTPQDMAVFLRALYTGALFQDPATLEAFMTRAAPGYQYETDEFYYMHGGYYKGGFLGHGGQTLGTESDVGYFPENDLVVVTWSNTAYAYTGAGIFHVGNLLGLTRSWTEVYNSLVGIESVTRLALEAVLGIEFTMTTVTLSSDGDLKQPAEGSNYTLTFNEAGQISIVADCNTVLASYTAGDDNTIDIELGASTLVACPEGSLADAMLMVLDNASSYSLLDLGEQFLLIVQTDDDSTAGFNAAK